MTHVLALGPGESLDGFDGLCPSWLRVISERNHSWGVKGETPTVDGIFTRILTCSWSGRHSQLTHGRASLEIWVELVDAGCWETPQNTSFRFSLFIEKKKENVPNSFAFQTAKMERFELYIGGRVGSNSPFHWEGLSWKLEICK